MERFWKILKSIGFVVSLIGGIIGIMELFSVPILQMRLEDGSEEEGILTMASRYFPPPDLEYSVQGMGKPETLYTPPRILYTLY